MLPFALILLFLAVSSYVERETWRQPAETVVVGASLWAFSRGLLRDLKLRHLGYSLLLGVAVFVIWVAPDTLVPGYREHWLFENAITGTAGSSLPEAARSSSLALALRSFRAVVLVPIAEELFWRGWLMRWIIDADFWKVEMGAWSARAFWITAVLFASEHGAYWDVGLAAGILYNGWMVRAKSLGDCILAHSVTNALLSAWVLALGKWEYWM